MPSYGFLPFLYLLQEYEDAEEYENCQIIFDAMNEMSEIWGLLLPTRLNKYAIDYYFKTMEGSKFKGHEAFENIPLFVNQIKEVINSK